MNEDVDDLKRQMRRYPSSTVFLMVMVTLIFILQVLELVGETVT